MQQEESTLKLCPRCQQPFICRQGAIDACGCRAVVLSDRQRVALAEAFSDCLCPACLAAMAASPTSR